MAFNILNSQLKRSKHIAERGAAMIASAIIIPVILLMAVVVFDLARLYVNVVYAQEVALFTAKLLSSTNPDGYAFPHASITQLVRAVPGEDPAITTRRTDYWTNRIDSSHPSYWGITYYPDHDKRVLNLAYQFALDNSPKVYFPIPVPLSSADDLGDRVNCTIEFSFVAGHEPPDPVPVDMTIPANATAIRVQRDRIVEVSCAVPLFGLKATGLSQDDYKYVRKRAYAYRGGNIRTTTG